MAGFCIDCEFYSQNGKFCEKFLVTKHDMANCLAFKLRDQTKQMPKTCDTCIHWRKSADYDIMMCHNPKNVIFDGSRIIFRPHSNAHCIYWESKYEKENDNMAKVPEVPEIPEGIQKIVDSAGAVSELCGITYKQLMAQGFTAQQAMELTKHILSVSINHK